MNNEFESEEINYVLKGLAANLYPLIGRIKGDAYFIKAFVEEGVDENNQDKIIQMLERIIRTSDELEAIRTNLQNQDKND